MQEPLHYWYKNFGASNPQAELPPQAIPKKRKNNEWVRANLDALERIGLRQLVENLSFKDYYRMAEGKHSYYELAEVLPQLRDVQAVMEEVDIPAFLRHYDLIGVIANALVGEFMQNSDKYFPVNDDEISSSEYQRDKSILFQRYIKEAFNKELNRRLINAGINPFDDGSQIEDEEQRIHYLQQLEQSKREMAPQEIEKFMRHDWKTNMTLWCEHILERDADKLDELSRKEFLDYVLTGRAFRHYKLGFDNSHSERWSPINTFFSQDLETERVEDGEYVGRIHYFTGGQILTRYGHRLSEKDKIKLTQSDREYTTTYTGETNNLKSVLDNNFGDTHLVPFRDYYKHDFLLGVQDEFNIPLGQYTYVNKDGTEVTVPRYLPSMNEQYRGDMIARRLREDLDIRSDLYRVTEAYWVSYKRVGYLTYETPTGVIARDVVTEDLLKEFIKENKIKQLRTTTLEELEKNPQENKNTIVWEYVPVVHEGVKISHGNHQTAEAMYLGGEEMEMQLKGDALFTGDTDTYHVKLPVCGLVSESIAKKIEAAQIGFNVCMNQIYNLIEKEIGMFYIFDMNFLPSEFKDWGSVSDSMVQLRNMVKEIGMLPVDSSRQNLGSAGQFNQFAAQNLSYSQQIADRMQLAEFYRREAYSQLGFNPQRLGTPIKYETAEGVRQSTTAAYNQTEIYFERFSEYVKRTLDMYLNVAQFAQKNGKDISLFYTANDGHKAFIQFTDPNFQLRRVGVRIVNNSKRRRELETFKNYVLQNNTMGSDEIAVAELLSSDSMVAVLKAAVDAGKRREEQQQAIHQRTMEQLQSQKEAEQEKLIFEWQLKEEYARNRDDAMLERERVEALGRAADKDAETTRNLDYINKEADRALRRQESEEKRDLERRRIEADSEVRKEELELRKKELEIKVQELAHKLQQSRNDKYIAEINKN